MGGKASKQKGDRAERDLVQRLRAVGLEANRVPLSGAVGGDFAGDVIASLNGEKLRGEVKVRARGFSQLYDWLAGNDFLVVRADRRQPLVVIPIDLALKLAKDIGR